MGWTYYRPSFYKNGKVDRKAELDYNYGNRVVKSQMVGTTWFAAIKSPYSDEVWAAIYLTAVDKGDFGYKDMDETEHPFYYDCPESILKLLTPTDNENANIWREKCRKRNKDKKVLAKHEPIILTVKAPLLSGHKPGDRVKLHWDGWGQNWFYTDGVYRYSNKTILNHGFEVDADYQLTKKALDL